MHYSRILAAFLTAIVFTPIAALPLMTGGCAALVTALPFVLEGITDAMLILDQVQSFVSLYFAQHKDQQALYEKIVKVIDKVRSSMIVAERTAKAAKDLSDKDVQAALKDFSDAWTELMAIVNPIGVSTALPGEAPHAAPGKLVVPQPAIFQLRKAGAK